MATTRATEVAVTKEFSAGVPVWTSATIYTMTVGSADLTIPTIGNTQYAVRTRTQDVFGNFSPWSNATTLTTAVGADSVGVQNAGATVIIDSTGITILNGALTLKDQYGSNALTGAGFGDAWRRFITNGVYNGDFFAAPAAPASAIDDATNPLPYWSFHKTSGGLGSAFSNADATNPSGRVIRLTVPAGGLTTDEVYLTQTLPVNSSVGRGYFYEGRLTFRTTAAIPTMQVRLYLQYLKKDGVTATGAEDWLSVGLDTVGINTVRGFSVYPNLQGAVPSDAYFLRVRLALFRSSATTGTTGSVDFTEFSIKPASTDLLGAESIAPSTHPPLRINQQNGVAYIMPGDTSGPLGNYAFSFSGNGSFVAKEITVSGPFHVSDMQSSIYTGANIILTTTDQNIVTITGLTAGRRYRFDFTADLAWSVVSAGTAAVVTLYDGAGAFTGSPQIILQGDVINRIAGLAQHFIGVPTSTSVSIKVKKTVNAGTATLRGTHTALIVTPI
jgi:hypothetical protein